MRESKKFWEIRRFKGAAIALLTMSWRARINDIHCPVAYAAFCVYLKERTGIDLGPTQQYLVFTRLKTILVREQMSSLQELVDQLHRDSRGCLHQDVIDCMTTNETFWFRDDYPFDAFKNQLLPGYTQQAGTIKIWCVACSSGQEPYSLAMAYREFIESRTGEANALSIWATDVSAAMLTTAQAGLYDRFSVSRGLSDARLKRFFHPMPNHCWQIDSSLQKCVRFDPFNVRRDPFPVEQFDLIFCRNLLIYFDAAFKKQLLTAFHLALKPEGLLFLGASESCAGAEQYFDLYPCKPGIAFKKR